MEIKKLNEHYSITRPSTVYDEEALTTLELVGRTTAKVNEVVDAQNKLSEDTANDILRHETYIKNVTEMQTKYMTDATVAQNIVIENIKTETVPAEVKKEVNRNIASGEFSEEVDRYYNNLSRRVDNLANLSEGSTTGDAELIDGRVDADGAVHTNIGANIRNTQNNINGLLNPAILTTVDAPIKHTDNGYNDYNGVWHGDEWGDYTCVVISVKPGEIYFLRGSATTDHPVACVTNSAGSLIRSYYGTEGTTLVSNYDKYVIIPPGGANLLINTYVVSSYISDPGAKKVIGFNVSKLWSHLKWACVGDSLTEKNLRSDKNYHDYINEKTGINVVNLGVSGTGYVAGKDASKSFVDRLGSIPSDADVITIFGSGNDLGYSLDELRTAFETVLDNLYRTRPGIPVGVISPTPWTNQTPDNENCGMYQYVEALRTVCERRGVPFLDLFRLSGFQANDLDYTHTQYFSKDPDGTNVHPNEAGHKILASHVYNFLNSLIGTY